MRYRILGPVIARDDHADIALTPQRQLLLAILLMAEGRPVTTDTLVRRIWESRPIDDPVGALRTNITHLRSHLGAEGRQLIPPLEAGGYRLLADPQHVDVHRFHGKLAQARDHRGEEALRLTQEALNQWGPDRTGLYGGQPLSGLAESWAGSQRDLLRQEYRDAQLFCLRKAWEGGAHGEVTARCDALATEAEALGDEQFVGLWMLATYHTHGPQRALEIYDAAQEAMTRRQGLAISADLAHLAMQIRSQDRELSRRDTTALPPPATPILPPTAAYDTTESTHANLEEPVREPASGFTFNNHPGANIGAQGQFQKEVTVHVGQHAQPTEDREATPGTGQAPS